VNVGALQILSNGKPVYFSSDKSADLSEATHGSLTGDTAVSTTGRSRKIVCGVVYKVDSYEEAQDDNGADVKFREDDGFEFRVYMGAEVTSGSEVPPTSDINNATTVDGFIPLFMATRTYGQTTFSSTDLEYYHGTVAVNAVGFMDQTRRVQNIASTLYTGRPLASKISLSETNSSQRQIAVMASSASNGGKVSVDSGQIIALGGSVFNTARVMPGSTGKWTSLDLDVSSTYFLRAQLTSIGSLRLYTQKGSFPGSYGWTIPGSLVGNPNASSGGEFPSTPLDLLIAKVDTGLSGSTPTVTVYNQGDFSIDTTIAGSYTSGATLTTTYSISKPYACDYDISVSVTSNYLDNMPPVHVSNASAVSDLFAEVVTYNYEAITIKAHGRWLETNSGSLRVPSIGATFRPQVRLRVRSRPVLGL
jgi:hypothetical protein